MDFSLMGRSFYYIAFFTFTHTRPSEGGCRAAGKAGGGGKRSAKCKRAVAVPAGVT